MKIMKQIQKEKKIETRRDFLFSMFDLKNFHYNRRLAFDREIYLRDNRL